MSAKVLRKEAVYPYPPEQVWVALTDPRALAEWLMPNDFQPILGHIFEFRTDPYFVCTGRTICRITELDPPRRMAWTWKIVTKEGKRDIPEMLVTWTLTPEGSGTRLVLEHSGLERAPWWVKFSMGFGWGTMVKSWVRKVAGNVKNGVFTPGAIPLQKRCYKVSTVPVEYVR